MFHEIGVAFLLIKNLVHPLKYPCMYVTGDIAEVGWDASFHESAVHFLLSVVDFLYKPYSSRNCDFIAARRRFNYCSQFFRTAVH